MTIIYILISGLLHIAVILAILSTFFHYFILEGTFSSLIKIINYILSRSVDSYFYKNQDAPQELLLIPDQVLILSTDALYTQSASTIAYNKKLYNIINIIIALLLFVTMAIVIYYKFYKDSRFYHLIIELFITFTIIGCIEFLFFTFITKKYISVSTSDLFQMIYDELPN